jgi:hypothetical protein
MKRNVPLKEYSLFVFSGFIESDKKTAEEVKREILEHHKKKKVKGLIVTVIKCEGEIK